MLLKLSNPLQVGLTIPFVLLCLVLIASWWDSFAGAFRSHKKGWSAEDWLIIGIVVGFTGNMVDNLYWGVTWFSEQYHLPTFNFLLKHGPIGNIFFRQMPGLIAVYCHLRAAKDMSNKDTPLHKLLFRFSLLGAATFAVMMFM